MLLLLIIFQAFPEVQNVVVARHFAREIALTPTHSIDSHFFSSSGSGGKTGGLEPQRPGGNSHAARARCGTRAKQLPEGRVYLLALIWVCF